MVSRSGDGRKKCPTLPVLQFLLQESPKRSFGSGGGTLSFSPGWIFFGKWDSPAFFPDFASHAAHEVWDFDMNWAIDPWSLAAEYPFSLFLPGKRIVGRHGKSLIEAPPISSFWCQRHGPRSHTFAAVYALYTLQEWNMVAENPPFGSRIVPLQQEIVENFAAKFDDTHYHTSYIHVYPVLAVSLFKTKKHLINIL